MAITTPNKASFGEKIDMPLAIVIGVTASVTVSHSGCLSSSRTRSTACLRSHLQGRGTR